jgi:hypothetical protein
VTYDSQEGAVDDLASPSGQVRSLGSKLRLEFAFLSGRENVHGAEGSPTVSSRPESGIPELLAHVVLQMGPKRAVWARLDEGVTVETDLVVGENNEGAVVGLHTGVGEEGGAHEDGIVPVLLLGSTVGDGAGFGARNDVDDLRWGRSAWDTHVAWNRITHVVELPARSGAEVVGPFLVSQGTCGNVSNDIMTSHKSSLTYRAIHQHRH